MDQLPSVAANVHVPIFWFCPGKTPTIRSFSHKQATGQEMRVRLCFSPGPDVEVASNAAAAACHDFEVPASDDE